jgi:hypothetical protein
VEAKPIVVLVASHSCDYTISSGHNPEKEAFSFTVRSDYGCEVWVYDDELDLFESYSKVKAAIADGSVILLAIMQSERCGDDPKTTYAPVRKDFPRLPIVVFSSRGWQNNSFQGDKKRNIKKLDIDTPSIYLWIRRLVKEYNAKLKARAVAVQMSMLERAYAVNYLGDSEFGMFGVPSHNDQIVAEYLRIRLTPSEQISNEFDRTIDRTPRKLPKVDRGTYQKEMERIRVMERSEREEFCYSLDRQPRGYFGVGYGPNASGFSIDPETLETVTTHGFGNHGMARFWLAHRLKVIQAIRGRLCGKKSDPLIKEANCEAVEDSLPFGLIIEGVEGFETPILRLWVGEMSDKNIKRIITHIISLEQFIPVDGGGELFQG